MRRALAPFLLGAHLVCAAGAPAAFAGGTCSDCPPAPPAPEAGPAFPAPPPSPPSPASAVDPEGARARPGDAVPATRRGPDTLLVPPEVTTQIDLSNRDVNWFRCDGPIDDVVTSTEKNVEVRYTGNNAFLKFKSLKVAEEMLFSKLPTELYIVCQGSVYKMIAMPVAIPAVTVRLGSPLGDAVQKNREHFAGLPWERKLLTLIYEAYTGNVSPTYQVVPPESTALIPFSSAASLRFVRGYLVSGEGLGVYEFQITNGDQPLQLDEQALLKRDLRIPGTKAAVVIEHHHLQPRESVRAFVVTRQSASGDATADSLFGELTR